MAGAPYEEALRLLDSGDVQAASLVIERALESAPDDPGALFVYGRVLFILQHYAQAVEAFAAASHADPANVEPALAWSIALKALDTQKAGGAARDLLLELVERFPGDDRILREAASACQNRGPLEKALELWRRLAARSSDAEDQFRLSESLAVLGRRREAVEALRAAARLDPKRYGAALEDADIAAEPVQRTRVTRARYPESKAIRDDLKTAIIQHVLGDLDLPKFITRQTSFFTMGSCFAWNIARALKKLGYSTTCMPMSEEINTSFANRRFVDWLEDAIDAPELAQRIADMLPGGISKESLLADLRKAEVFIMTLGVGAAFFDRATGAFVMPKPSSLNTRTLAEKYEFRTTSVAENVENVAYVIDFARRVNPDVRVFVTVSPVPMHMTFEFASAVVADCISKSTMRVAAHEVVSKLARTGNVHYFPSFEVFRWLGAHLEQAVYGTDDGAAWHVSEEIVDLVLSCFVEKFAQEGGLIEGAAVESVPRVALVPLFSETVLDRNRPIFFYGSGQMGQGLLAAMGDTTAWKFKGFIDSWQAGSCNGHPVFDLAQFRERYAPGDAVVVTSGAVSEIARTLSGLGITDALDANPWWRALRLTAPLSARY
jgi:tetratricopeptide (TPR) repeat protein